MKFKSNLLCRSAPQSANFPPTFPLKGNAMESMQRTLRGRHSVRRELRIFEILEALLAREIIERSSFATPSRWIGSIQSSIRRPLRSFKNKIIVSRLRFNSLTWFFEIFLAKIAIAKESRRRNLFFFFTKFMKLSMLSFCIKNLVFSDNRTTHTMSTFHMKYYNLLFIYIYVNYISLLLLNCIFFSKLVIR